MPYQMDFGWAVMGPKGFEIVHKPSLDEWVSSWREVVSKRRISKWARGYLYVAASDGGLGEEVHQFISPLDVTLGTVQSEASVCRAYLSYWEFVDKISFSHHEVVAVLDPDRRRYWLQRAIDEELTCKDLREITAEEREKATGRSSAGHKKSPLERLKTGRDAIDAVLPDLPEGPWVGQVQSAVLELDEAIEVLQDNLAPIAIGAPAQPELAGV